MLFDVLERHDQQYRCTIFLFPERCRIHGVTKPAQPLHLFQRMPGKIKPQAVVFQLEQKCTVILCQRRNLRLLDCPFVCTAEQVHLPGHNAVPLVPAVCQHLFLELDHLPPVQSQPVQRTAANQAVQCLLIQTAGQHSPAEVCQTSEVFLFLPLFRHCLDKATPQVLYCQQAEPVLLISYEALGLHR